MSTISHNGQAHELIDTIPNWAESPRWILEWEGGIGGALSGEEDRAHYRRKPRAEFTWTLSRKDVDEWLAVEAAITAALLSGRAAVPLWPRPSSVLVNAGGTMITVDPTALIWRGKDLQDENFTHRLWSADGVRTVSAYNATTGELTLDSPLDAEEVYPLVFGRLEVVGDALQTDTVADLTLRLQVVEWTILAGPIFESVEMTMLATDTVTILEREFYFAHRAVPGGVLYPITIDGRLLDYELWLYGPTAPQPEAGSVLLSFYSDGVVKQAWVRAL